MFLVSRWLGSLFHPFESYCAVNERGCLLQPYRWKMVRCSLITVPWSFSWHPWDPIWYLLPLDDNVLFANKLSMFKSSDVFPIFSHPFSLLFGEILPLEFCPQSFQPLPKVFLEEDLVQWTRKTYKITVEVSPLVFPIGALRLWIPVDSSCCILLWRAFGIILFFNRFNCNVM